MELFKDVSIREVGAPVAAASNTDSNSDRIDMSGYEGVIFITAITDSVDTGVAVLKAEGNSADSDTGMTLITGASSTATSAANDDLNDQLLIVSVNKPQSRYVQAVRTSATANLAFGSVIAILYGGKKLPESDHSTVLDSAAVVGS